MAKFIPNKEFLHSILLYYFHKEIIATTSFHNLQRIYGENVITKQKCKKWFECFKRGNYVFECDGESSSTEEQEQEQEEKEEKETLELQDSEELKLIAQFIKHINEMGSQRCSKKITQIYRILLSYYNVISNNVNTSKSEEYLLKLYHTPNVALKTCKNLLEQLKKSFAFEHVVLPQIPRQLEEEVTPPIYNSHYFKNKMLEKMKKCDCRIVKIRKVQVPAPKKSFLRKLLLHFFIMRETAYDCHSKLFDVYGDQVPAEKTCKEWFKRFRSGNFDLNDENRSGRAKKFEDAELEAILKDKTKKSQKEIADMLGVTQQTISHRLKANRRNQK